MGERAVNEERWASFFMYFSLLYCSREKESYYRQGLIHESEKGHDSQEGCPTKSMLAFYLTGQALAVSTLGPSSCPG